MTCSSMARVRVTLCVDRINFMIPTCNQQRQKSSFSLDLHNAAKVVPLFACSCQKWGYLAAANGSRSPIIHAVDAVVGAGAAASAVAGIASGAHFGTEGARRTGIAAKSRPGGDDVAGRRPARQIRARCRRGGRAARSGENPEEAAFDSATE